MQRDHKKKVLLHTYKHTYTYVYAHTGTHAFMQEGGRDAVAICQREKFSEQSETCLEEQESLLSQSIFLSLSDSV